MDWVSSVKKQETATWVLMPAFELQYNSNKDNIHIIIFVLQ